MSPRDPMSPRDSVLPRGPIPSASSVSSEKSARSAGLKPSFEQPIEPLPLIEAFAVSGELAFEHRWHVRDTLELLTIFIEQDGERADWGSLVPAELMAASMGSDPGSYALLRDLLDVSASFYRWLGAQGHVGGQDGRRIGHSLARMAMGAASQLT